MNPKIQKTRAWLNRTAILLAIMLIAGLVGKSNLFLKSASSWKTAWFTRADYEKAVTDKSYYLEAGEWSDWIITPAGSKYRIDTSVPVEVCFIDNPECDKALTVYPSEYKKPTWFGIRRGIFRVWSSEPASITVSIER